MFGVILWSDPFVKKAVIWCEDQGNLAYYEAPKNVSRIDELFFDTGDYVEFDVEMDRDLCRASNAQIVLPVGGQGQTHRTRRRTRRVHDTAPAVADTTLPSQVIAFADHAAAGHAAPRLNRRG